MGFWDEESPTVALFGVVSASLAWAALMVTVGWWGVFLGWLPAFIVGYAVVSWWKKLIMLAVLVAAGASGILIGISLCG